jgi:hypothetical protein
MGRFSRRFAERQRDDAFGRFGAQRFDARGARLVPTQTIKSFLDEALLPTPNAGLGLTKLTISGVSTDDCPCLPTTKVQNATIQVRIP